MFNSLFLYPLVAVVITSSVAFLGVLVLVVREEFLRKILLFLVSISAGALFGDAFLHLIPDAILRGGGDDAVLVSSLILFGVFSFFILEKFLHWHHHHADEGEVDDSSIHPVGYMTIIADIAHNFIDGVAIAASFAVSVPVGVATTFAVFLHEIPHEVGNVALLIHSGFEKRRAVILNLVSAVFAILGTLVTIVLSIKFSNIVGYLIPFTAGTFIYIAGSDLLPELHKSTEVKKTIYQFLGIMIGIFSMYLLLIVG